MTVLSVALSAGCLIFRVPLLRVIFGAVEADVMKNSQVYFLFTLLSFPFIGLHDGGRIHSGGRRTTAAVRW